jgi:hypothetical protein
MIAFSFLLELVILVASLKLLYMLPT